MNSALLDIQSEVKQYAQMIQSLFGVDVDVCDSNLIRVAGIGRNNRMIGKKFERGHLSGMTMREKRVISIFNPYNDEPCRGCASLNYCGRFPRLYFPLVRDEEVFGAISIIAVTAEQSKDLQYRKDKFILFMETVCDLIASKVRERRDQMRNAYHLKLQERLINVVNEGLMILDDQNRILFVNKRCEKVLGCTMPQIRQLTALKKLSVTPLTRLEANGRIEYQVKIRSAKIRLSGHAYEVNAMDASKVNRIFVFVDIRTLHESLEQNESFEHNGFDGMIGASQAFRETVAACRKISYSLTPALLVGEPGTGKEVFARAMHNESALRSNQFIRMAQGGAIWKLIEKSVFGDGEAGDLLTTSRNELLEGNTLYIDEVSDLSMERQRALLDIIQNSRQLNSRIVCGTSKSLKNLVESVDFHPELFYSLDMHAITIPPLRARREDIALFVEHYLRIANRNAHKNISLAKDVLGLFMNYGWPGNIREVENAIVYIVENTEEEDVELSRDQLPGGMINKLLDKRLDNYNLEKIEKRMILQALNDFSASGYTRTDVAKALGIGNATLYRKMKQYGIRENSQFQTISNRPQKE